jgi:hypothetical protein
MLNHDDMPRGLPPASLLTTPYGIVGTPARGARDRANREAKGNPLQPTFGPALFENKHALTHAKPDQE